MKCVIDIKLNHFYSGEYMKNFMLITGFTCATTFTYQASALDAVEAKALAKSNGCLNCHSMDTKLAGPSFHEVSAKYAKQPGAVDKLVKTVKSGSNAKVWGANEMPPQTKISESDAKSLIEYILTLHP
jgi:cytochrome c